MHGLVDDTTARLRSSSVQERSLFGRFMALAVSVTLLPVASCTAEGPTAPQMDGPRSTSVVDLSVASATDSSLTVRWTQVSDGAGEPADYRVKYAEQTIDWGTANTACTLSGNAIGVEMSCLITGLAPDSTYDVQLMSYRVVDGAWQDAAYSNITTGETEAPTTRTKTGIWMGADEIAALPMSGPAWNNLLTEAQASCETVDLSDRNQTNNVCIMAKALVYARTGEEAYADDVLVAIGEIVNAGRYDGRALALGRELAAYVIAADLIDLASYDPTLDQLFRAKPVSYTHLTLPTKRIV